jgi:hypothetical protein
VDLENLKETDIWTLYEQGRDFCSMMGMFRDTDTNYRMYNGNQWEGVIVKGIEPIQENFIKPIVKYKVGNITTNLWQINFSSENFEDENFRETADKTCDMLNRKTRKTWEKDGMDYKVRHIAKDSAINDEGIMYVTYDMENQEIINEVLRKNNIFYGNENDEDIQNQPYIIIKRRMPVVNVHEMALAEGVSEEKLELIKGDKDTTDNSGDSGKYEKDDMCTILTKMYKENGSVHFEIATKYVEIKKDTDTGLKLYPLAHMIWESKEGSARGEGEVRHLIPNQVETNKILTRSALVVKLTAYQTKVVNKDKIANYGDINKVGATLYTKNSQTIDDVNKIVGYINPAQMSPDVEKLRNELIKTTRELAGAGDIATGQVNPESASGRAILAVQQASQLPLTEQLSSLKAFIEDVARIWLDMLTTYSMEGLTLEEEVLNPETGEDEVQLVQIPQSVMESLKASVKVDITPKGAFDKYAQELSLENMLKAGLFNVQRLPELKRYVEILDDDAVAPKTKLEKVIKSMEEEQEKIAMIDAQARAMELRAKQFIDSDPDAQASIMAEATATQPVEEAQPTA